MPTVDELGADAVAERAFLLGLLLAGPLKSFSPEALRIEVVVGQGRATLTSPWSGRRYRVELRGEAAEGEG